MQDAVPTGSKRKRVGSGSENALSNGRSRSGNRVKRRKALDSSDDEATSSMDVDDNARWDLTDSGASDDEDGVDSSDNYLIHEATRRELLRFRKDELVRLYTAAGLTEDAELLTKPEIVDCIMTARDDVASLPPSSPPDAHSSGSSDYSSDGGNVAGGEETDIGGRFRRGLARRNTIHDVGRRKSRPLAADRCYSLSQLQQPERLHRSASQSRLASGSSRRNGTSRAGSSKSSPTTSTASTALSSPPATRTRSRKHSNDNIQPFATTSTSSKGKGKGKQVEFDDEIQIAALVDTEQESDLTDLAELEESLGLATPSPRRLRSKGDRPQSSSQSSVDGEKHAGGDVDLGRRVTPMRKAKWNVGSLKEEDTEEEEDELAESDAEDVEEEADELPEEATPKPNRTRRTPLRNRLRSRRTEQEAPSDGDDEGSDDESVDITESVGDEEDEEDQEADDEKTVCDDSEGEEGVEEDELVNEPRVLRNGKVVGADDDEDGEEEDVEDPMEELTEEDAEGEDVDEADLQDDAASVDLENGESGEEEEDEEADETEEAMDEDIDLTVATAKSLVRLRRDDLVRMCEHRELNVSGTKPQLAEALLQWRDKHCSETASSPSSAGTARPPSTSRPRRRKTRSSGTHSPPVLERSDRVHLDEPRTPPLTSHNKETEPELELDLESLGLDDREIPPEKLTKLEKIGSGGFKDVFIGKFKGRKVAIAEFRGQLNAMDIKELKLLGDFNHPNIVRFLGVSIPTNPKETPVMIVSELCSNGDLFDYVRNVDPPTLYRVLSIMLDIARGLEYLHTRKPSVIHRDCKSSNILITSKGVAKITDFGLAKVKQSTRSMVRSLVGTVNWQAPELWHPHPKYNHKVDVFSCAMVFWEMLQWHVPNKKFPWEGMNEHAIYDLVGAKRQRPSTHGLKNRWCPEIVDLMEHMWEQDPADRPTMTEVVQELERLVAEYR
ncbi:protein kinase [Phanerochaete sordida]|uniref:Protein kinase n=1 Tax=Phanerochaete sordida TaxID=48140 RepID=A0A9P3GKK5_9APHY|nr:protein kinase [Phanerochaete sordida]